jgi:tRNA threonylcarbamoyladenosine biosynthesis protein TsaB
MLILAVDTSTRAGSVAVLQESRLLGVRTSCATQPQASGLFVDLQSLLDELRIPVETFDLFAVSSGPGSFTGLRIGLTAAKAWAEAFDRPVVAVSSLDAIVFQSVKIPQLPPQIVLASVQDARRGQVFGRVYKYDGGAACFPFEPLGEEVLLPAPEFVELVAEQAGAREAIFVSPAPESIQPALNESAWKRYRVESVSGMLAPPIAELGYARALDRKVTDALHLDANYVRRTDAEVKWTDVASTWSPRNKKDAKSQDKSPA